MIIMETLQCKSSSSVSLLCDLIAAYNPLAKDEIPERSRACECRSEDMQCMSGPPDNCKRDVATHRINKHAIKRHLGSVTRNAKPLQNPSSSP